MEELQPYWCVAFADELPDTFSAGLVLSEGFSVETPDEIPREQITYAVLCRTVASSEDEAHASITASLHELSMPASSPLVTIDAASLIICRRERRAVSGLARGDTSVHSSFIGFKRDDPAAKEVALQIIRGSLSKKKWQFWR